MADAHIQLVRQGPIATVTLQRENKLHALTPAMLDELEHMARALQDDDQVRVVVLTASGDRAFCVGADITTWSALSALDMWRRWVRRGHQVFDQWAQLRQPVIGAINGHAFGGGLELALTCDIRLGAAQAQFALPEASIGTCPGWSGSQRLVQLIGASHSKYLALSGRRLDAASAQAMGLLHEVLENSALTTRATVLAQHMSSLSPTSLQMTKQLINAAAGEGTAMTLEALAGGLAASTEDAQEGIRSFNEKRSPHFQGR